MIDITTIGIALDTGGLEHGKRALQETEKAANKTADAADHAGARFSALSSALDMAKRALMAYASIQSVRMFIEAADALALMDARLKLATKSTSEFVEAQKAVYKIAQANSIGLQETATLYTKMADPVRSLGGTAAHTAGIVDAFAKTLKISGASSQEAAAATLQFAQAMGSGKLQGDEFRSMAETSPRFMKAMAEGMGVPIAKLKEMGSEGKLTADVVGNALLNSLGKLTSEAKTLPDTVGNAFTRLKTDALMAVNEINKQSRLTLGVADLVEVVRGLVPVIKDQLADAFMAVGAFIDANKAAIGETWNTAKGLVGDVWELAKAGASVLGFLVQWEVQSGLTKSTIETLRLIVAGVSDGVEFVGASFATVGSIILKVVLAPLQVFLDGVAKVQGLLGNTDGAKSYAQAAAGIREFAGAGASYGDVILEKFKNGNTAVARLSASLTATKNITTEAGKAADEASGKFDKLKPGANGPDKEAIAAANAEMKKQADLIAELNGLSGSFYEQWGRLAAMRKADKLSLDQLTAAQAELLAKQPAIKAMRDAELAASKLQAAATEKAIKLEIERLNAIVDADIAVQKMGIDYAEATQQGNERTQFELGLLGQTAQARQVLLGQYDVEIEKLKKIKEINGSNASDSAKQQAIASVNATAEIAKQGVVVKAALSEADAMVASIEQTAHTTFTNLFQDGANAFQKLGNVIRSAVIDLLYQMTIKKWVIQVSAGISAGMVGGAANAGGIGAGDVLSAGSMLGNLGNLGTSGGIMGSIMGSSATYGAAIGTTSIGAGSQAAMLAAQTAEFGAAGAAMTASAGAAGNAMLGLVPEIAIAVAAFAALNAVFGEKNWETKYGGAFDMQSGGSVAKLYGPGTGGEFADQFAQKLMAATDKGINDLFTKIGSTTRLSYLTAGAESSKEGEGFSFAGAKLSTGQSVGQFSSDNNRGDKTPEEAAKALIMEMQQVTLQALQAATDIPKSIADKLAGINIDGLSSDALANLTGEVSTIITNVTDLQVALGQLPFESVRGLSFDAAAALIEFSGGLDALKTNLAGYYKDYYSAEEQRAQTITNITDTLNKAGINVGQADIAGASRAQFRALAEAQDLSTTAGQKAYAAIMGVAGAFAGITDTSAATKSAANDSAQSARDAEKAQSDAAKAQADAANAAEDAIAKDRALQTKSYDLQSQIYKLTNDTAGQEFALAEQRRMALEDLAKQDASGALEMLQSDLWKLQDAAKGASETLSVQAQIAEVTNDKALAAQVLQAQRAAKLIEITQTSGIGVANLTQRLWDLQEQEKKDSDALKIKTDRLSLFAQIADVTSNKELASQVLKEQRSMQLVEIERASGADTARLTEALWGYQDAAKAAAEMLSVNNAKYAVAAQYYEITGDAAGKAAVQDLQRANALVELNKKDPTGVLAGMTEELWKVQDAAKAAAEMLSVNNAKYTVAAQYYEITGDAAGKAAVQDLQRAIALTELNKKDPTGVLAGMTEELWKVQDAAKATADASKKQSETLSVQAQIADVTGNKALAAQVLQAQRTAQLADITKTSGAALAVLTKQLWDVQDAFGEAADAAARAADKLSVQAQIADVTGNKELASEVLKAQRAAQFDEIAKKSGLETAQLTAQLWSYQDAAKAAQSAAAVQEKALSYQVQIAELSGDTIGKSYAVAKQRATELDGINKQDPSGQLARLARTLWDLQDAAKAAADAAKITADTLAVQAQIAEATGDKALAAEVLQAQRSAELGKLSSTALIQLTQRLWEFQDAAKTTANELAIRTKSLGIQSQVYALAGDTSGQVHALAEQRRMEMDDLNKQDPSGQLAIFTQSLWALQDARPAVDERKKLLDELDAATMGRDGALKKERDAINASNLSLFDQVKYAQAAQAAMDTLNRAMDGLASTKIGLQQQLLTAQGDAAGALALKRKTELDALLKDTSAGDAAKIMAAYYQNTALEDQIAAQNDAQKSADDARQKAKESQKQFAQTAVSVAQDAISSLNSIFDTLHSNVVSLRGAVDSSAVMQAQQGQAFIANALRNAKASGYMPDEKQLSDAIDAARSGLSSTIYTTQADKDFATLELAGSLSALEVLSGSKLTLDEQSLQVAKEQLAALDAVSRGVKETAQTAVDSQSTSAQNTRDITSNISANVLPVDNGIRRLEALVAQLLAENKELNAQLKVANVINKTTADTLENVTEGGNAMRVHVLESCPVPVA